MSRSTEIGAAAWRISRELADGTPDYLNPKGAFAVCGGITKFTHDFEIEKGVEIFLRDSVGTGCVNIVRDSQEKWVNGEVTLCKDDYRIWEILGLAHLFTGNVGRGHTMAAGCLPPARARVALELWVEQYDCTDLVIGAPYKRHTFTKAVFEPQGYDVSENPSLPVFKFRAFNNANFTDGPFGDLDILVTDSFVGAMTITDDTAIPVCPTPLDYIALPASAS